MKDHKVVVMPNRETLGPQVNVAAFAASQGSKTPVSRRPVTAERTRQGTNNIFRSKSPGKRHVSRSRDIVQEVYDRMGVNYVRGQNYVELYDSTSSVSINSLTKNGTQSSDRVSPVPSIISRTSRVSIRNDQPKDSTSRGSSVVSQRNAYSCDSTSSVSINSLKKNGAQSPHRGIPVSSIILSKTSGLSIQNNQPKESTIRGSSGVVAQCNGYSSVVQNRHSFSADTRNEQNEKSLSRNSAREDIERISLCSGRSVKSMVSVFSGGKSLASNRSSSSSYKAPPKFVNATPNEGEKISDIRNNRRSFSSYKAPPKFVNAAPNEGEKVFDVRNDNDVDADMSVVSLDECQWVNKQQQQQQEDNQHRPSSYNRSSSQNSKLANSSKDVTSDRNNTLCVEKIEAKFEAKLAELNASFTEKFRQLESNTDRRLEEIEGKLKTILKEESSEIKKLDKPIIKTVRTPAPRGRRATFPSTYGSFRL